MAAREGDEQKLGYELSPDFLKQYRSSPGAQQQVQPEADAAVDSRVEGPRTPENVAEPSRGTALSSSSPDPPRNARAGFQPSKRDQDPYMKDLPEEFDPDNPPDRGLWAIYEDGPPEPPNQEERLQTVHKLGLLDAPEDPVLNSICDVTCSVLQSMVSGISVVDKHRLWYHATGGPAPRFQHHISLAFCGWNMLPDTPEVHVIEDTFLDRRFMECPAILHPPLPGTPAMRFYAGAPLIMSNGHRIGSLCLMDIKPRQLQAEEASTLANFAELAARHIEKDLYLTWQKQANEALLRSLDCFSEATIILDLGEASWKVLYANASWTDVTGTAQEGVMNKLLLDVYKVEDESQEMLQRRVKECLADGSSFFARFANASGAFRLRFRAASKEPYSDGMAEHTGVPSRIPASNSSHTLFIAVIVPDTGPKPADTTPSSQHPSSSTPASLKGPPEDQQWLQGDKGVLIKSSFPAGFPEATLSILIRATKKGRIFRARWQNSDVAVKVSEDFEDECVLVGDTGHVAPAEATLSVMVAHPQLVTAYKYALFQHNALSGKAWVETWLLREHCARGCLTDAILRGGLQTHREKRSEVNVEAVLATAAEVASALMSIHSEGLVHGDLTGDCVWLADSNNRRGWTAKVLDFGAQKPHVAASDHLGRKHITHAAPELLEEGKLSKASDVYALGALVWEMCAQSRIYSGLSFQDILSRVALRKPPPRIPEKLPPELEALTDRCMAAEPADRPNVGTVQKQLVQLLANSQKSKADAVQPVQAEPDDEVSSEEASPSVDTRAQSSAASGCNPLKIVRSFRRKIRSNGQAHASEE